MNEPVPARVPAESAALDEVRLRGMLYLPLSAAERAALFADVRRALRPGGRVFVHVLTGGYEVSNPTCPARLALCAVPFESDPLATLSAAGFVGAWLLKFDAMPCFVRDGVGMRETQLEAFVPPVETGGAVDVM